MKLIFFILLVSFSLQASASVEKNTIFDPATGLMWQDNVDAKSVKKNFSDATKYCEDLTLSGYDDWYLPTAEQLLTITDKTRFNPSIKEGFTNINSQDYWSSSSHKTDKKSAWTVYFKYGYSGSSDKRRQYNVRCARAGHDEAIYFETLVSKIVEDELSKIPKPPSSISLVRDEFETTKEFEVRVKNSRKKQAQIVEKYKKDFASSKVKVKNLAIKRALQMIWGKPVLKNLQYDADNGYFLANLSFEVKKSFVKNVAIKIDRKRAREFKKEFSSLKPQAIFNYDGNSLTLKDIKIPYKSKFYKAQFTDISINDTRMAVNISSGFKMDTSMNTSIVVGKSELSSFDVSSLSNFSELNDLLKKSKKVKVDNKKWLFVIGIEKYEYTDNISYAKRSAEMFAQTAQKRLGVSKRNSYVMINDGATQAKIKQKLKRMLRKVKDGDTIYFYYNGHGVPVPSLKNEPFMLTSDTEPDFVADDEFFSLKNIYTKLSDSKAEKIIAFVDSCFSGVTDGKSVLKGVAATKMVSKSVEFDKEKMVVISAGKGHQYSNGYDKKAHRLFSFFVIKNIIDGKEDIKSLYKNTKNQTYDTSLEEYGDLRVQEPTIDGNFRLGL